MQMFFASGSKLLYDTKVSALFPKGGYFCFPAKLKLDTSVQLQFVGNAYKLEALLIMIKRCPEA